MPYLEDVTSLVNARETRGEGDELIVGELLEDWPENDAERAAARERALANRLYRNLILSEDGRVTVVAIELSTFVDEDDADAALAGFDDLDDADLLAEASPPADRARLSGEQNVAVIDAVRQVVARHQAPDFTIHVTGIASLSLFLQEGMRRDMTRFTGMAVLTIAVLLGVLFRSFAGVALPLIVVVLSLVATLGLMSLAGVVIGMPTQILPSFLLAVGVGGAVHLVAIFFQHCRAGQGKRDAIVHAAGHSGLAIIMTSFTTAGAMASFATAALAPIEGLGLCAPGGVLVALVLTLVLLPALIALLPMRLPVGAEETSGSGSAASPTQRGLVAAGRFAVAHRGAVMLVSAALLLVSVAGALRLHFSHAPLEWFSPTSPFYVATILTNERLGGSVNLEVLVDTGTPNGLHEPEVMRQFVAASERIAEIEHNDIRAGKSVSLADTLREIHQALNENRPEFYAIPQDSRELVAQELLLFENAGSDDLEDVTDAQFRVGRMTLRAPMGDAVDYIPFLEEVERDFEEVLGDGADVHFTGLMPILGGTITAMMRSMAASYTIAFFVILVLLVVLIGDVKLGLAAMIPNLAPILIVMGAMGYAGIGLDGFTMLIGSIAIGLAVDDTIHFMHNFRRYLHETGDARRAVELTLSTAGQAMLFTTLVLSSGFVLFAMSSMPVLTHFGLLTAAAISLALVSDVLLAPALMTWLVEETS